MNVFSYFTQITQILNQRHGHNLLVDNYLISPSLTSFPLTLHVHVPAKFVQLRRAIVTQRVLDPCRGLFSRLACGCGQRGCMKLCLWIALHHSLQPYHIYPSESSLGNSSHNFELLIRNTLLTCSSSTLGKDCQSSRDRCFRWLHHLFLQNLDSKWNIHIGTSEDRCSPDFIVHIASLVKDKSHWYN